MLYINLCNIGSIKQKNLSSPMANGNQPNKIALLIAIEMSDCAKQLERLLQGKPTEAKGFKI